MVLHIKDFLKDESNATPAFVEAIGALSDGDTLCLDGGKFNLRPEGAFIKTYYMSNNDGGVKPIVMPIINKKNITVDGGGATLVFKNCTFENIELTARRHMQDNQEFDCEAIEVSGFEGSPTKNIKFKNITIDNGVEGHKHTIFVSRCQGITFENVVCK